MLEGKLRDGGEIFESLDVKSPPTRTGVAEWSSRLSSRAAESTVHRSRLQSFEREIEL